MIPIKTLEEIDQIIHQISVKDWEHGKKKGRWVSVDVLRQKLQQLIADLDDFLVHWLWNDIGKHENYPSDELNRFLDFRENYEEVLVVLESEEAKK